MEFKTGLGSNLEQTKSHSNSNIISCLEYPSASSIGKEKVFIRPLVSRNLQNELPEEPHESDTITNGSKNRVENIVGCHEEVNDKIQKALKSLTLCDEGYLIQFWAPCSDGKYMLLKTVDQPFHLGKPDDGLCRYRRESERNWFLVDEKCEEEELIPVARVFRRQLPEWTSDVMNYYSKKYPLQDCAIRLNLHGYLVLPVFDSYTMLCVGVLEFITYLKHLDCAYEVQEVHRILKAVNLTSPQAFDSPASYVNYKNRQHELDEIFMILKELCDTYSLPLAQTWRVSSWSSFTAVGHKIEMTCSCFNSSCIGKVCMSATALPFHVHDLHYWNFREACRKHHLLESQGVVGRALSSHGSSFCADVTELGEDEYPLVHNARMSRLRSCFAIYLNSREHDHGYVLEFFLPVDMKESAELQNLVQKLKMHDKFSSFERGDQVGTEVIGRATEVSQLSLSMQLNIIPTSMSKEIMQLDSEDSQTVGKTNAQNDCISSQDPYHFTQVYRKNLSSITNSQKMSVNDVSSKKIDVPTEEKGFTSGEKGVFVKQRREHNTDSLGSAHIEKYIEKSISEASLGFLSKEILNFEDSGTVHEFNAEYDFCNGCPKNWNTVVTNREKKFVDDATSKKIDFVSGEEALMEHRIKPKFDDLAEHKQKYSGKPIDEVSGSFGSLSSEMWQLSQNQHDLVNSYHKNWSNAITNTEERAVTDVIAEKTDVVTVENGYNFERKGAYTKRRRKRKMDSVTPQMIQQYFGKPIGEASTRLGVSRSTLKRVCRELNIPRWPFPQRDKKYSHFSISVVIRLLIIVKRWSCSISNHGFSAKWWICGKHNAFASKSNQSDDSQKGETICEPLYLSTSLKELDDCIEMVIPFSKPQQACFGIYEAACLLLGLKRWRKRTVVKHATLCNDYLIDDDGLSDINIFNVFSSKNVVNVSDTPKATVKATYKDDIVKFDFPLSSGLSKLKNQVAQRIKLQAARFHLKYKDEDDDLILIACDDDLCNLMPFSATSASKNTIKLIVEMANG